MYIKSGILQRAFDVLWYSASELKEKEVGGQEKLFSIPNRREVGKLKKVVIHPF
jgi:hypothetical protein